MPALSFIQQAGGLVDGVVSPAPTATFGTIVTAGSLLVASVAINVAVDPNRYLSLVVTDNNGNTWRQLGSLQRGLVGSNAENRSWAFFWVSSANGGSTQAQATLTCTNGINTCTITACEFGVAAWSPFALNSVGTCWQEVAPASPVKGPLWTAPGNIPCLFVASGTGTRADFVESADDLNQLTPQLPTGYRHYTSYVIEPSRAQQQYFWTGNDTAHICSAQIGNGLKVGDYPAQLGGQGAGR